MWDGVVYDNNFPEGISYTEEEVFGYTVQTVDLPNSRAGALLKRSPGQYIVVQTDPIDELEEYEPLASSILQVCWPSISIRDCIYLAKIENDPVPIERWAIESSDRRFY